MSEPEKGTLHRSVIDAYACLLATPAQPHAISLQSGFSTQDVHPAPRTLRLQF
jgi:hypothetical protein